MSFLNTHQLISYLKYYARAKTIYSIHSPFLFTIMKEVIENKKEYYSFIAIEQLKRMLSIDKTEIELHDLGAGSQLDTSKRKTVAEISKTSVSNDAKCRMLFQLSRILKPDLVLELGTSLGISALSISKGNPKMTLHTIEGDPQIQSIAQFHLENTKHNIISHQGSFDEVLPGLLEDLINIDFVFIDGNHRYDATIQYHNMIKPYLSANAIIIYDDIYWSQEMSKAWLELKSDDDFQLSLDVFEFGMLFKRKESIAKQDFTVIRSIKKPWKIGISG